MQKGYVALIAVLVMGAAALAIATTLLISGTDSQRSALVGQQNIQARSLASACGEEGLQQIHDSTSFTGTNNLSMGQGTCSYTVTNTGGSTRTVDATGTINGIVRKIKVYVTIGASSISVTSWQEVT
jgi:hypothetical protein